MDAYKTQQCLTEYGQAVLSGHAALAWGGSLSPEPVPGTLPVVIEGLVEKIADLQKFKDYVHKRLDEMGIESDPEGPHKAQGCRVGGRLDIVAARVAQLKFHEEANEE